VWISWGMGRGVYGDGDGYRPGGWCGGVVVIDESGPVVMEEGRHDEVVGPWKATRGEARRGEARRREARAVSCRRSVI